MSTARTLQSDQLFSLPEILRLPYTGLQSIKSSACRFRAGAAQARCRELVEAPPEVIAALG